jgi:hydroxymethylglutaryl-CoA lyase
MTVPPAVDVREVAPRDGLQAEAPVDIAVRVELIESLLDAGVTHIEAGAFVSPRAVPAMAGAAGVLAALQRRPGVVYAALVPNLKGAELALAAGVDELTVTVSVSEDYSARNVRMSVDESVTVAGEICVRAAPVPVDVVVSCAFGSPYEGDIAPGAVAALVRRLADGGAARATFADTTGMATPARIDALLDAVLGATGYDVGLHVHDTRGSALVNAYRALQ